MCLLFCIVLSVTRMGNKASKLYIANGSRCQVEVYDLHETQTVQTHNESSPGTTPANNHRQSGQSVIIGVGDVTEIPRSFNNISIFLCNAENKRLLHNWNANKNKPSSGDRSIIVTKQDSVQFGYSNKRDPNWMWMNRDGTNHRPTESFVANASGRKISVRCAAGDSECVSIEHGGTATVEYEDMIITSGDEIFHVKPKPRTSIIVFSDHIKVTGQLHGVNIDEEKWKVDGTNYKPLTKWESLQSMASGVSGYVTRPTIPPVILNLGIEFVKKKIGLTEK